MFLDTKKTVRDIKNDVGKHIGHPPSKVVLFLLGHDGERIIDQFRFPNRAVHTIHISDGDNLYADYRL